MSNRNYGEGKVQMICDTFDNLLEPHVAEYIESETRKEAWVPNYLSNKQIGICPHWHIYCGETEDEIVNNKFDYLLPIYQTALWKYKLKEKYNISGWKRLYMNAHTFGMEHHIHKDDGDFTMMYYPRLDWKPEWLGGTAIWDDDGKNIDRYVNYIGNRLLIFPAKNNHQAMPVSRYCYGVRPVVVFKCWC